jgi:multiple sugar transport system substrate-binding protein
MTNKSKKIGRRKLLKLAAAGTVGLAVSGVPVRLVAQNPIKIRVQVNDKDLERPIADLLISNNPHIQVEQISLTGIDHEEVASKILALVASGEPLDTGFAATEATQLYAAQGLAAPLKERIMDNPDYWQEFFSDVHPSLIEAMMFEDDLYEIPFDFNAANMYFNMNVLAENGIELPGPDWTKDDFVDIARKTTKKTGGSTDIFGFAWTNRLWGSWMPWIFVAGGNLYTEERAPGSDWMWDRFYTNDPAAKMRGGGFRWQKPIANSQENIEALELVVSLWEEGITPDVAMGTGQTLTGFYSTGKLAMIPAGGFWAGRLAKEGMVKGDFDVQLWPSWRNQKHQFGTGGMWLSTTSENPDDAWKYIKTYVSNEAYDVNGLFNPVILTTPARRSRSGRDAFESTGPANSDIFYDTLDKHPDTAPIPAPPWSIEMTSIFTRFTGLAMAGEMRPKKALDEMQEELEALTARQPKYYG